MPKLTLRELDVLTDPLTASGEWPCCWKTKTVGKLVGRGLLELRDGENYWVAGLTEKGRAALAAHKEEADE